MGGRKGRRRCNNQLMTDARAGCCHFGSTKSGPLTFSQIMRPKRMTAEQTWNLSKILHRRIFRLKILHRQFHLREAVKNVLADFAR